MDTTQALREIMEKNGAVSLSAVAVQNGETTYTGALGYADRDAEIPTTPQTLYRIASCSKTVSCLLMMGLVDKGVLDLDADIGAYLGYRARNPHHADVPITLRQLATHTSSIVEYGGYNRILSGEDPARLLSEVLKEDGPGYSEDNYLSAAPGTTFDYSSFGTGILGAIVEKVTGKPLAVYANEALFTPLGITASYDQDDLEGETIAVPYEVEEFGDYDDFTGSVRRSSDWLEKSLANKKLLMQMPVGEAYRAAQGNVHITPTGLSGIMAIFLNGGVAKNGARVLSEQATKEMLRVQFDDGRARTGLGLMYFGGAIPGMELTGHYGRAFGAFTVMLFHPEKKNGAIAFCNGTRNTLDADGHILLCNEAVRSLYPL